MLNGKSKTELLEAAKAAGVKVHESWAKERIIKEIEASNVIVADKPSVKVSLSEKVKNAPVRFFSKTGRIYIRNSFDEPTNFGVITRHGLVIEFGDEYGSEASLSGGLSREFYPDLKEHDDASNYCCCAKCLEEVRDYVRKDPHGIVAKSGMHEVAPDAAACPISIASKWHESDAAGIKEIYRVAGFDIEEAIKYERAHDDRDAVIKLLDELADTADDLDAGDVLGADIEISLTATKS